MTNPQKSNPLPRSAPNSTEAVFERIDPLSEMEVRQSTGIYGPKVAAEVLRASLHLIDQGLVNDRGAENLQIIIRARLNGETYQEIGNALGCSRQNVEHFIRKLSETGLLSEEAERALHRAPPREYGNPELQLAVLDGLRAGKTYVQIAREEGYSAKTVQAAKDALLRGPRREETLDLIEFRDQTRRVERLNHLLDRAAEYTNLRINHGLQDKEIMEQMGIKYPPELYGIKKLAEEQYADDAEIKRLFHARIYRVPPIPPLPDYEGIRNRQKEVLKMVLGGMSTNEISESLGFSRTTIDKDIIILKRNYPEQSPEIEEARAATRARLRQKGGDESL